MLDAADGPTPVEGFGYEAYRAARERFLGGLRADSETRRLEALWATSPAPTASSRPAPFVHPAG
jgi:hypothetical protein